MNLLPADYQTHGKTSTSRRMSYHLRLCSSDTTLLKPPAPAMVKTSNQNEILPRPQLHTPRFSHPKNNIPISPSTINCPGNVNSTPNHNLPASITLHHHAQLPISENNSSQIHPTTLNASLLRMNLAISLRCQMSRNLHINSPQTSHCLTPSDMPLLC